MSEQVEAPEQKDAADVVTRWLKEIDASDRHEKSWRERAQKVIERYRNDKKNVEGEGQKSQFNVLYANTEILKGVVYQKSPVPDVRRRFLDPDPIARQVAQVIQRALSFCIDPGTPQGELNFTMEKLLEDYLLPGRAMARIRYIPTFSKAPQTDPATGQPQVGEDGKPVMVDQLVYEEVKSEYIEWDMVRLKPARAWNKVSWLAFGELMTRDDLKRSFGQKGALCSLDWSPPDKENETDELYKRALVWQVWDKNSRKVLTICKGYPNGPLSEIDDPLGLEGFFPTPAPLTSIYTNTNMIPVPEFLQYQDQAVELDALSERIDVLIDGLRRRGVYDGAHPELEKLSDLADNQFIAVENWASLMEKGGIEKALFEAPLDTLIKVLMGLYEQRDKCLGIIYQITGISDIVRGESASDETATAQGIKARYANVRVSPRQMCVARYARDLIRMMAEVIADKFGVQTLKMITGPDVWQIKQQGQPVDVTDQIMQMLKSERLRGFRVDIETDSTVEPDAQEEQKNRIDFVTAVTKFIVEAAPAVQSGALPMNVAKEILSFGARGFKVSPQLEDALDQLGGQEGNDKAAMQQQAQKMAQAQVQQAMQEMQGEYQKQVQGLEAQKEQLAKRDQALQAKEMQSQNAERMAEMQRNYDQTLASAQRDMQVKIEELERMKEDAKFASEQQRTIDTMKAMMVQFQMQADKCMTKMQASQKAEHEGMEAEKEASGKADGMAMMQSMGDMHKEMMAQMGEMMKNIAAPRKLVRGEDGTKMSIMVTQ